MNSSDPTTSALMLWLMFMLGAFGWVVYLAGIIVGFVAVAATKGVVRNTAWHSLRAQLGPIIAFGVLAIAWILQGILNQELFSESVTMLFLVACLAVGPFATLWLIGTMVWVKLRGIARPRRV